MKRTHLVSLLMVLVVGGGEGYFWHSFDKSGKGSGVKVIDDVAPDPMAENPRDEPLFLRGRNANADNPHVFETFNAEFVNLRP
ncbi:hypothetical protein [Pseudomonas sp. NPDC086251]|jgi:hypothetical protein|uniref:hypothetical protein n=1 Tax=Pseudomonas sp. NPDC086251 TaxID=3364431 RepID=UPI00383337AE